MKGEMDRRDFLKFSMAAGALLVAGEGIRADVMAEGAAKTVEADKVTVWVLTDNYYDWNVPDSKITKRYRPKTPGKTIHAEHGLSYYIETVVNGKTSACMFDYGLDPTGLMDNIALLGVDPGKAEAFGLSHGHGDYMLAEVAMLKDYRSRIAGTPFFVGEEAFLRRYSRRPGGSEPDDLGQLGREDIEALGLKIIEVKSPTQIIPGAYITGNIERVTTYEKVPPTYFIKRGEKIEPDDLKGEQALFFNVKGKGLLVLSSCAHGGIVNLVKHAQKVSGIEKVHAVMGGFHLINAKPDVIQQTIADMKVMKPDYLVGMHCTGFNANVAFSREMPKEFILNTAGTRYTFGG